jgi:hypothetical protein
MPLWQESAKLGDHHILRCWQIVETALGERHCVGMNLKSGHTPIISPIITIDSLILEVSTTAEVSYPCDRERGRKMGLPRVLWERYRPTGIEAEAVDEPDINRSSQRTSQP